MKSVKKIFTILFLIFIFSLVFLLKPANAVVTVEEQEVQETKLLSELLDDDEEKKALRDILEKNKIEIPESLKNEEEINEYILEKVTEQIHEEKGIESSSVDTYNSTVASYITRESSTNGQKINDKYYNLAGTFKMPNNNSKYEYSRLNVSRGNSLTGEWTYRIAILKRDMVTNTCSIVYSNDTENMKYDAYYVKDSTIYILYEVPGEINKCHTLAFDTTTDTVASIRTFNVTPKGGDYLTSFVVDGNENTYIVYENTGLKTFDKNGKEIFNFEPLNDEHIIYLKGVSPNNKILFFEVMYNSMKGYYYYQTVYEGMNKLDNGKFIPTGIDSSGNNKYSYSVLSRKYPQVYSQNPVWSFINDEYAVNQYGQIVKFDYNSNNTIGVSYTIVKNLESPVRDYGNYVQDPQCPTVTKYENYYYIVGSNFNIYRLDSAFNIKDYLNIGLESSDSNSNQIYSIKIIDEKMYIDVYMPKEGNIDYILNLSTAKFNEVQNITYSAHSSTKHSITDITNNYKTSKTTFNYKTSMYLENPSWKAPYIGGALKQGVIDDGLRKLNYYRWLLCEDNVSVDTSRLTYNQKGATLLQAINVLTHDPYKPADMSDDFYAQAETGCGAGTVENGLPYSGNIAYGCSNMTDSIEGWVADLFNVSLGSITGHRQSLLDPRAEKTSFGQAGSYTTMSMYYDTNKNISKENYYAFPSAGYFPTSEMKTNEYWSLRWTDIELSGSISIDFEYKGKTYKCTNMGLESGFNAVSFRIPDELISLVGGKENNIIPGTQIKVKISGFKDKNLNNVTFEYIVDFFDMSDADVNSADIANLIFDYKYYADNNPDLKAIFGYNYTALKNHYYTSGIKEGRVASPVFNPKYYLYNNSDLKKIYGLSNYEAAYNHFVNCGWYEQRPSSKEFCGKYYEDAYADLKPYSKYFKLAHYINCGRNEGRKGTDVIDMTPVDIQDCLFNSTFYADMYADLKKAFGYNSAKLKEHWLNSGIKEGRIASPYFDANYYLNNYSDLKKALGNNYMAAYNHFINSGIMEGRKASKLFDVKYYVDHYSDLQSAYGENYSKSLLHFYTNGLNEGRDGSSTFKLSVYKSNYMDLYKSFGNNNIKYYIHYASYGDREGRKAY